MSIDPLGPVYREIPAASAVPQLSLTRRDRELQMEEGQPPIEVAEAEQQPLRWNKEEDPREKWRQRRDTRNARRNATQCEAQGEMLDEAVPTLTQLQESPQLQEEEETGTLFDDRS